MTLRFERKNITVTEEQRASILAFCQDHLGVFGGLPMDVELENDGDPIVLDYSEMLSALSQEQVEFLSTEYAAIEKAQAGGYWVPSEGEVPPSIIGGFVDSIAGKSRTPQALAGRLLEEMIELCMATGLSHGDIMMHVTDAMHNQALKDSRKQGKTVFPSAHVSEFSKEEVAEEIADVGLVLKDLVYVTGVNQNAEEVKKWSKFTRKQFRVSDKGTLYAVKAHIKDTE